ncbi:MAG: glucose-1-phosphate adenylyltransferase [Tissierellia bacterium]|nr:glucose-1-phosphate adenylyltransferase [Tissierellia bacterium]
MDSKVVAMLLAGGQGSRLKALTKKVAKPAVAFGGKYRIIDFPLSNAANSGIDNIAILTQYKPFLLNSHIGIGSAWDYDRNVGGLRILSPFTSEDGGRWYTGTANAIYENIDYLDELDPNYVLVLSGDHIYKMDYEDIVDIHKEKDAAVTLAVMEVPWEDCSRFGIINVDKENFIVEFDEKPENPKNNMASMGIYLFNWSILREYLIKDASDKESDHDFGKNILPRMLAEGNKMYAWKFDGYWKDVGTVRSYWEANMDLLDPNNTLNLYDKGWRIYTKSRNLPPQYLAKGSRVVNSLVNEGCYIEGDIERSIIFSDVVVEEGAVIRDSVILSDCIIKKGARVNRAVVLEETVVEVDQVIGKEDTEMVYVVEEGIVTEE